MEAIVWQTNLEDEKMKAAVMGYGTIGSGVVEVLDINGSSIAKRVGEPVEIKYVLI